jgi:hypothetical protein
MEVVKRSDLHRTLFSVSRVSVFRCESMMRTLAATWTASSRSMDLPVEGRRQGVRLVVEQEMKNSGSTHGHPSVRCGWAPNSVEWKAIGGPLEPLARGRSAASGEVEVTEARGTFPPKRWNQDAGTGEFFDGVRFP